MNVCFRKMNTDLNANQSSMCYFSLFFSLILNLKVMEWVKQKIHETEIEIQSISTSCTITMDDFRVNIKKQTRMNGIN